MNKLKSWKTTVSALVFLAANLLKLRNGPEIPQEVFNAVESLAIFAIGFFARDSDKDKDN